MEKKVAVILKREVLKSIPPDVLNCIRTYDKNDILKKDSSNSLLNSELFYDSSIVYTENEIWYSHTSYKINNSKAPFLQSRVKSGFTYNIETKKIRFWLGSTIMGCIDFFVTKYSFINKSLLTNTTCAGLISGDIKNLYQLCEKYIKANKLSCKTENLYECVKNDKFDKMGFLYLCKISYNSQDDILLHMTKNGIELFTDSVFSLFNLKISTYLGNKKYSRIGNKYRKILSCMKHSTMTPKQIVSDEVYNKYPYEVSDGVVYIKTNHHYEIICSKYNHSPHNDLLYGFEFKFDGTHILCLIYQNKIYTTKREHIKKVDLKDVKEFLKNTRNKILIDMNINVEEDIFYDCF